MARREGPWQDVKRLVLDARDGDGWVYFIEEDEVRRRSRGFVKVGWTTNLDARLRDLQIANPRKLDVVGLIPGTRELEAALHEYLEGKPGWRRYSGEWFEVRSGAPQTLAERLREIRRSGCQGLRPPARYRDRQEAVTAGHAYHCALCHGWHINADAAAEPVAA